MSRFFASLLFLVSATCFASGGHHHGHGHDEESLNQEILELEDLELKVLELNILEQQAHIHGYAELMLAVEADALAITLESPAVNIVGFEYAAKSANDKQAVKKAKLALESPETLFILSGGGCTLREAGVDMSALQAGDHSHHKEKDGLHREITASYSYQCKRSSNLEAVAVKLFELFPRLETLRVMWLTEKKQGSVELTANASILQLR